MSNEMILRSTHLALTKTINEFKEALDGIPDSVFSSWFPAAAANGGGDMNTLAGLAVHTAAAGTWRIVHQIFGGDYDRDRESEFTATATRAEIDALFDSMLDSFETLIDQCPDVDLAALPPTIRKDTPTWTRADYLTNLVYHTALHTGHAQIHRQLWLAENRGT